MGGRSYLDCGVKPSLLVGWFAANRRKAVTLVSVLIAASALSVYAWLSSLTPQGGPRVAIVSPPLEFWMELDKTEYAYGENVTIAFRLKNISNETITVSKSSMDLLPPAFISTEASGANGSYLGPFHFGLSITDSNGTVIYERFEGPYAATYRFTVEPDGYVRQIFFWKHYDWLASPLPKGTYQIRGIFYGSCIPGFLTSALVTPSIAFIVE